MFIGTHENRIDRKGRVSVPARFREELALSGDRRLFLYPSVTAPAVCGCSAVYLQGLHDRLERLDPFAPEREECAVAVFSQAHELSIDSDGRVVLPEILRQDAQLEEQAMFVGLGALFQLWSPPAYRALLTESRLRARQVVAAREKAKDAGAAFGDGVEG